MKRKNVVTILRYAQHSSCNMFICHVYNCNTEKYITRCLSQNYTSTLNNNKTECSQCHDIFLCQAPGIPGYSHLYIYLTKIFNIFRDRWADACDWRCAFGFSFTGCSEHFYPELSNHTLHRIHMPRFCYTLAVRAKSFAWFCEETLFGKHLFAIELFASSILHFFLSRTAFASYVLLLQMFREKILMFVMCTVRKSMKFSFYHCKSSIIRTQSR